MGTVIGWFVLSVLVGFIAESRGRSGPGFFILSVLLSPLIGLIVVLIVRNLKEEAKNEALRLEEQERHAQTIRAIESSRMNSPNPQTPSTSSPASVADEIRKLGELRDQGLLTQEEFQSQKTLLLRQQSATATALFSENNGTAFNAQKEPSIFNLNGICPYCDSTIPLKSAECPKCRASFRTGSLAIKPIE